ncbi:MAG TPA: EAL domain-containing protein [Rugosibacter sp.]
MNPKKPFPPEDANGEVPALIEVLIETDQHLENLTAGEVDAVTDCRGRTSLLRRSQDNMRDSEAAKQTAILNALPAHIALLDSQGRILSVNETWRRFDGGSVLQCPGHAVGFNYLDNCDRAPANDASEARQVAQGIRSVLSGEVKRFSLEYPCHSATQRRWLLMTVMPLADTHSHGAVVMHMDITERKRMTATIIKNEERFRALYEASPDAIMLLSPELGFMTGNPATLALFGCRDEQEFTALSPAAISPEFQPDGRRSDDKAQEMMHLAQDKGAHSFEWLHQRVDDGTTFSADVLLISTTIDDKIVIQATLRDITERKANEARIVYLNRVYAMLSGINTLIVRVHDRDELFREACRIALEEGGFRMSLIGIKDQDSMTIVPVASAGKDEELLTAIQGILSSRENAPNTMVTRAIREKKIIVSNDSQNDPQVLFNEKYAKSGIRSMAIFPLIVADEAIGVLALYADKSEFFHEDDLKLLTELAGDIAFAIDHIEKQERLDYLAYYDALTGLANQRLFLERITLHMHAAVSGGHKLALFLLNLERFKYINDSLGWAAGDTLLKQVAEWLTRNAGDANLLARLGADHFAVVLPEIRQEGDVTRLLEKMMKAFLDHPFHLNDAVFRISIRVGGAVFPDDGADAETLFRHAEAALKKAKARSERYLFYTSTMTAAVAGKLTLENQLRQALDNQEFVLYYQPKVNLASGKMTSAEALIRWNDPRTGLVPPGHFIPILEETGLIYDVGRWALRQAIADYLRWRAAGLPAVRIAVNVSPLQLRHRGFIDEISQVVGIDAQAAAGLELEITESLIMEDIKHNITSLQAIRAMGVRIAIDDFGTGFSSLSYLAKLPVDTLKIDRSFVIGMTAEPEGLALVSTIINLAHALKLKVVAEGVETEEQSRLLRLLNCDEMQGYLFSKPLPVEVFEARYLALSPAE